MALTYILQENVLTDNLLIVAEKNKRFKGNYIAIVKEYTFKNAWSDEESIKRFRTEKSLMKHLNKYYKGLDLDFTGTCLKQNPA